MSLLTERLQTILDDRNTERRWAISFALLLFCILTHNQWHCPQCSSSTGTVLTGVACYGVSSLPQSQQIMEATASAEPSDTPRVSLAFRVAYNGVYSVHVPRAFAQHIGRLHKWRRIPVYKALFSSVYMKYRQIRLQYTLHENIAKNMRVTSSRCAVQHVPLLYAVSRWLSTNGGFSLLLPSHLPILSGDT